jgi:hypothetical protein
MPPVLVPGVLVRSVLVAVRSEILPVLVVPPHQLVRVSA